jgi:protoporphyrinogen oxidase
MAGFGAATALAEAGVAPICYDKNAYYGGHTTSFIHPSGFIFDDGPHLSFTKDARIQALLADNVGQQYQTVRAHINNYWQGHWIPHPAQCNLYGLPTDLVVRIVRDFVEARGAEHQISNYADWLRAAYGTTFAETFPTVYGLKYHTTTPDRMTVDWLGPRMYRPDLEEVLRGALAPARQTAMHYVTTFRYPTYGGFAAYLRPFAERAELHLCHELVGLDARRRSLRFANGLTAEYEQLISSLPLPELIRCIDDVPAEVRAAAAARLAFTSAVIVNVGVARADLSEAHISYFYDPDIIFARLNFPHLLSPNVAPAGCGSIQAEVYFSDKYRPLDRPPEALIEPVIRDLHRCGVLRPDDQLLVQEARLVRYANVIYDLDRAEALQRVHGFLDACGIHYCGRYGNWDHAWTDEAFISGERAAKAALAGQLAQVPAS